MIEAYKTLSTPESSLPLMGSFLLIIQIGIAIVISSLLSPYIPRVSMPLVQIILGVIWFFIPGLPLINLDSEFFMLVFIAPLLYFEAMHISRSGLRKNLGITLSLAVGLVLVSILVSGYTLTAFMAAIPLAAAFALGAALGPTDAVAVAQISSDAQLTERQHTVLSTESLFNDASSIVSFQFALAALMTGIFSPVFFTLNVIYSFIGGAVVGFIMAMLLNKLILWLRRMRLETTTNRILIELMIPVLVYWVADDMLDVSGVIAVVSAGLTAIYHRVGVGEDLAEVNRVSNAVWEVVAFVLNGSVFVLLGIELPLAMRQTILNPTVNTWSMVLTAAVLCMVLYIVRFCWLALMLRTTKSHDTGLRRKMTKERWHSALVMTFSGAKGTISLILAFSLPSQLDNMTDYPIRTAFLFIAATYIILSLLIANIVVPILAPPEKDEDGQKYAVANLDMLNRTLVAISRIDNPDQHIAIEAVMRSYNARIARQRGKVLSPEELGALHSTRIEMRHWQSRWLENYARRNPQYKDACQRLLAPIEYSLTHDEAGWLQHARARMYFVRLKTTVWLRAMRATLRFLWQRTVQMTTRNDDMDYRRSEVTRIQLQMLQDSIHHAFTLINYDQIPPVVGSTIVSELRLLIKHLHMPSMATPTTTSVESIPHQFNAVLSQAYAIELETIRTMAEHKEITHEQAKIMRHNVFLMQSDSAV